MRNLPSSLGCGAATAAARVAGPAPTHRCDLIHMPRRYMHHPQPSTGHHQHTGLGPTPSSPPTPPPSRTAARHVDRAESLHDGHTPPSLTDTIAQSLPAHLEHAWCGLTDDDPTPRRPAGPHRRPRHGCDASYFPAILFGIGCRAATLDNTPRYQPLRRAPGVEHPGTSRIHRCRAQASPHRHPHPCGRGAHRNQSRTPVGHCREPDRPSPGLRSETAMRRGVMSHNTSRTTTKRCAPDPTPSAPTGSPHSPTSMCRTRAGRGPPTARQPHRAHRAHLAARSADRVTVHFSKATHLLCLIISTTPSTWTGSTAPHAAAPTPTCSSPSTVNAATSAPGASAPPNKSAKTAPCSTTAARTPSPPPSLMASGVACPKPNAPATPGAPAAQHDPASVSCRRTL